MTAACLTLLQKTRRPLWPWSTKPRQGMLVEAFPAAQLKQWVFPYQGYNADADKAKETRKKIVDELRKRIDLGRFKKTTQACADALDAVLCAFAATGVSTLHT